MDPTPRVRLSHRATLFCKGFLWVFIFLPFPPFLSIEMLISVLPVFAVGYFWIWQLKTVFLDGETLIVKSWRKETRVPLKTVVGMGSSYFGHHRVWIEYAMPNDVVRLVVFMPGFFFSFKTLQGSLGVTSRSVHLWNWKIPVGGTLLSMLLFFLGQKLLGAFGG